MKRRKSILRLPIAGVLMGAVFLLLTGCGIATYPYLVPPEKVSAGEGFQHNRQVTSGVFRGYEIYYRIYAGSVSAGSITEETIIDDLLAEFQYRSGFEKVSEDRNRDSALSPGEETSVASPYWLAVASTSNTPPETDFVGAIGLDSPPLFPFEQTYGESNTFDVSMSVTAPPVELLIADTGYPTGNSDYPKKIYLYRRISSENGEVLDFTKNEEDYIAATETDGHADVPDAASGAEKLTIAFFAIIYGYDIGSFTPIFANSHLGQPAENIVFMGTVTAD